MGIFSAMASVRRVLFLSFAFASVQCIAADYHPLNFLTSFQVGFRGVTASNIRRTFADQPLAPKFPGFTEFRLQGERGLYAPFLTHNIDFEAGFGRTSGYDAFGTGYRWSMWFMRILPLGVTYWPVRLPFVDFGLNASFGVALAERLKFTRSSDGLNLDLKGKIFPAFDLRGLARLWIIDQLAVSSEVGLKYHTTVFKGSGYELKTKMSGFYFMIGATWAIGGISGTGARLIEVLSSQKRARKALSEPLSREKVQPNDAKVLDSK